MAATDDWNTTVDGRAANYVVTATNWNEVQQNLQALYSAFDGDAQATAEVIHGHKSGTYANLPAAGNAGRLYYVTDIRLWMFDNGTVWRPFHPDPIGCDHFHEDFHGAPWGTGNASNNVGWWATGGAGGTGADILSQADTNQSVATLETGTDATATIRLGPRGLSSGQYYSQDAYPALLYGRAGAPQTTGKLGFGLVGASPVAGVPADGIYMVKLSGGNWEGHCNRDGAGPSTTALASSNDTAYRDFKIEILDGSQAAGSVKFYANDVLIGEVTANVPFDEYLTFAIWCYSASSPEELIRMDYLTWYAPRVAAA